MKLKVTGREVMEILRPNIKIPLHLDTKIPDNAWIEDTHDITDLVSDALKVSVPGEMPWNVYEDFTSFYSGYNTFDEILATRSIDDSCYKWLHVRKRALRRLHQHILVRGMEYGFRLAEREFKLPLGMTDNLNRDLYVGITDDQKLYMDCYGGDRFDEQQLKDLNAPDWIMQLPREYVEE